MEPKKIASNALIHQNHESRLTRVEVTMETICTVLQDIKEDIKVMRNEMQQGFSDVRSEVKHEIAEGRGEMKQGFAEVRSEIVRLDTKIDSNFKWLLGMMLGSLVSILDVIAYTQRWI